MFGSEEIVKLQDIVQIFKNRLNESNCLIIVNNYQHHMRLCLFETSGKISEEMENLVIHFQNAIDSSYMKHKTTRKQTKM